MNKKDVGLAMLAGIGFLTAGVQAVSASSASRIDLALNSIQIQPGRPSIKDTVIATASVRNSGSEEAHNFFVDAVVRKDDKTVREIPRVPVLSSLPRQGMGLSVPVELGVFPAGEYEVEMTVDPQNEIKETDETNNRRKKSFTVTVPLFSGTY